MHESDSRLIVYHLRISLFASLGFLMARTVSWINGDYPIGYPPNGSRFTISISTFIMIACHQILLAFRPRFLVVVLHAFLCIIEFLGVICENIFFSVFPPQTDVPMSYIGTLYAEIQIAAAIVSLGLLNRHVRQMWKARPNLIVCSATVAWSEILAFAFQRYNFLDQCAEVHPPYTTARILLNRSLARPLVRGESRWTIILRGIILSAIFILIPPFAAYNVVLRPTANPIFTREYQPNKLIAYAEAAYRDCYTLNPVYTAGYTLASDLPNATIILWNPTQFNPTQFKLTKNPYFPQETSRSQVNIRLNNSSTITRCPIVPFSVQGAYYSVQLAECPAPWTEIIDVSVVVNFTGFATDYPWSAVYVTPGKGSDVASILRFTDPIMLLRGADLLGWMSWTHHQVFSGSGLMGSLTKLTEFMNAEIHDLQMNPIHRTTGPNNAILSIVQYSYVPTKYLQDYMDATPLTGLSNVGGLWTFVNGVFSIFFGANVLFFLFGVKPMSTLGVLHQFQRKTLERNLREDYPAFRVEGGHPGSKSAGVLALIRDRYLAFPENQDSETANPGTEEPSQDTEGERPMASRDSRRTSSGPDEISLHSVSRTSKEEGLPLEQYEDLGQSDPGVHPHDGATANDRVGGATSYVDGYRPEEIPLEDGDLERLRTDRL